MEKQVEERFRAIQFSQKFIDLLLEKLRGIYYRQREVIDSEKQILFNQKKAVEAKRDKAEEKLLNGVLTDDDFVRLKIKFKEDLDGIQARIDKLDRQKEYDINIVQEIIRLSHNIYEVYKTAPYELKRQYLGLFWDKFLVQDKKIVEAVPAKLMLTLAKKKQVIISTDLLPSPAALITILEDEEYMASLRAKMKLIHELERQLKFRATV